MRRAMTPITAVPQHRRAVSPLAPDAATLERFLAQCHRRRYPTRTDVFRPGDVGDIIMDFAGNGAAAGDVLRFEGFGPGATFTQLDDWTWQVTYNGGASSELLAFDNAATIHVSDFMFV